MKNPLIQQIPSGAEVTVTLRNGKSFTGFEASTPECTENGLLRLTRDSEYSEPPGPQNTIFCVAEADVICWELVVENS